LVTSARLLLAVGIFCAAPIVAQPGSFGEPFSNQTVCPLCTSAVVDRVCDPRTRMAFLNRCFMFCVTGTPQGVDCTTVTDHPTAVPTSAPSGSPTATPTTAAPTNTPTAVPSAHPTHVPTATPTRFSGSCPLGQFIPRGERRCVNATVCPAGQYEVLPPTLTSDRFCYTARQCSSSQFTASLATATSDTICRNCATCGAGQVLTAACTPFHDTVCSIDDTGRNESLPGAPCDGRCEFDVVATVCKPARSATPCPAYTTAQCPAGRCTVDAVDGIQTCVPVAVAPTGVAVVSSFYCGDNQDRTRCSAIRHCNWDLLTASCQDVPCNSAFTNVSCGALPGCAYDAQLFLCYDDHRPIDCDSLWIRSRCEATNGRCSWNGGDSTCSAVPPPGPPLCETYLSAVDCATAGTRCAYIDGGPGCVGSDEVPGCSLYTSVTSCPVAGTEYADGVAADGGAFCRRLSPPGCPAEFYQTSPTATTDRGCAALAVCTVVEFESTAPTGSSDRVCTTAATNCTSSGRSAGDGTNEVGEAEPGEAGILDDLGSGESLNQTFYIAAPATATTDLQCELVLGCRSNEFEVAPPTTTSDADCHLTTVCQPPLQFQIQSPTTTSDRRCQNTTVCRATEYQTRPATTWSDRECGPLTVCNVPYEHESVSPTFVGNMAVTDRRCAAVSDCEADEYVASAATPTSQTICRPFTPCTDGAIEVCPPVPWHDRVCAPESAVRDLFPELEGGDESASGASGTESGSGDDTQALLIAHFGCQTTTTTTTTSSTTVSTTSTSTTSTSTQSSTTSTTTVSSSTISMTTSTLTTRSTTTATLTTVTSSTSTQTSSTLSSTVTSTTTSTSTSSVTTSSTTTTTTSTTSGTTTTSTTSTSSTTSSTTTSSDTLHERLDDVTSMGRALLPFCEHTRTFCLEDRGCASCVGRGISRSAVIDCLRSNDAYRRYVGSCAPLCNQSRTIVSDAEHPAFECYLTLLGHEQRDGVSRLEASCRSQPAIDLALRSCPVESLGITAEWHAALIGGGGTAGPTVSADADDGSDNGGISTMWIIVYCVAGVIFIGFVLVVIACRQSRDKGDLEAIRQAAEKDFEASIQKITWAQQNAGPPAVAETSFGGSAAAPPSSHSQPPRPLPRPQPAVLNYAYASAKPAEPDARSTVDSHGGGLTRKLSFNVGSLEEYADKRADAYAAAESEVDSTGHIWSTAL